MPETFPFNPPGVDYTFDAKQVSTESLQPAADVTQLDTIVYQFYNFIVFEILVLDTFDSAHCIRGYQGSCERIHGHTYKVEARLRKAELDEQGLSFDFRLVKARLAKILDYLDHTFINDLPEFQVDNASAENISRFIYNRLKEHFGESVYSVTVWETPTSAATYWDE
jgi:6-pyruvoyltetrahydropterin/6-carboxytetrahydropterin synthase